MLVMSFIEQKFVALFVSFRIPFVCLLNDFTEVYSYLWMAVYIYFVFTGIAVLLVDHAARKVLRLKVGAPVVLLRNLRNGLYNGMIGFSHAADPEPIVNFDGRLVTLPTFAFEVFDSRQN